MYLTCLSRTNGRGLDSPLGLGFNSARTSVPCKTEASYALLAVGTCRSPSACAACSLLRDNLSPFYLASLSASFLDCASQAHLFSPWNQTTTFFPSVKSRRC